MTSEKWQREKDVGGRISESTQSEWKRRGEKLRMTETDKQMSSVNNITEREGGIHALGTGDPGHESQVNA